ncbi:hypothetical protein NCCP2495_19450 [Dietzia sp. NCCP-2495]|nr:hypothetical protein NCCP2495_19450 [Dietzia sp. NCCP-2495]
MARGKFPWVTTTPATWICDECGETIGEPGQGIVVWTQSWDDDSAVDRFRIVHKETSGRQCDPGGNSRWVDVSRLVGADGLAYLLSFLSVGPILGGGGLKIRDFDNYVDTVRRLQTPGYEQARSKFGSQEVADNYGDANEYFPYLPEELEKIIHL